MLDIMAIRGRGRSTLFPVLGILLGAVGTLFLMWKGSLGKSTEPHPQLVSRSRRCYVALAKVAGGTILGLCGAASKGSTATSPA